MAQFLVRDGLSQHSSPIFHSQKAHARTEMSAEINRSHIRNSVICISSPTTLKDRGTFSKNSIYLAHVHVLMKLWSRDINHTSGPGWVYRIEKKAHIFYWITNWSLND